MKHTVSTFNIKKGNKIKLTSVKKNQGPCVSPKRITRFQGGPTANLTTYPPPKEKNMDGRRLWAQPNTKDPESTTATASPALLAPFAESLLPENGVEV